MYNNTIYYGDNTNYVKCKLVDYDNLDTEFKTYFDSTVSDEWIVEDDMLLTKYEDFYLLAEASSINFANTFISDLKGGTDFE